MVDLFLTNRKTNMPFCICFSYVRKKVEAVLYSDLSSPNCNVLERPGIRGLRGAACFVRK